MYPASQTMSFLHSICAGPQTEIFAVAEQIFVYFGAAHRLLRITAGRPKWEVRTVRLHPPGNPTILVSQMEPTALASLLQQCGAASAEPVRIRTMQAVAERPVVRRLYLDITLDCNLRCRYCYVAGARRQLPTQMPEPTALRAVDWLLEQGDDRLPLQLRFFGGEPLLRPELLRRVIRYGQQQSHRRGLRLEYFLSTNGTLLDPDLARFLHDQGVLVKVSLDGSQATHDAYRVDAEGRGSYAATVRGLRVAQQAGLRPTVCVTSGGLSPGEREAALDTIRRLGIEDVQWQRVVAEDGSDERVDESRDDLPLAARAWESLLLGDDRYLTLFAMPIRKLLDPVRVFPGCGAGLQSLTVTPDGEFCFCQRFLRAPHYRLGSLDQGCDYGKLRALLGGLYRSQWQRCRACPLVFFCSKGCYYANDRQTGDVAGIAPGYCRLVRSGFRATAWLAFNLAEHFPAKLREMLIRKTFLEVEHG